MVMLIAWQTINAMRRPSSKKFSRGFLVVTPGITIKDRLRVRDYSPKEARRSRHSPDCYQERFPTMSHQETLGPIVDTRCRGRDSEPGSFRVSIRCRK
ncbi:MAG: hypothetical protein JNN16_18715 [Nitrospira sp.]|nr:hypothetical protein [Nitrospira sp.]